MASRPDLTAALELYGVTAMWNQHSQRWYFKRDCDLVWPAWAVLEDTASLARFLDVIKAVANET